MSEAGRSWPPLPDALGPLNPEQEQAVLTVEGPVLVLAGAGSGKTRVLTRRIAYMIEAGIEPEHILAVTFTNKAAAEMKERVVDLVGDRASKTWVSTFHSACCRILRLEAEHLGYTRRFAIYDDDDQLRILRQIVKDEGYDPKVVVPKAILGRIDHHKNRMTDVESLVATKRARRSEPLVRIWETYEEALRAADALDFNDLINKVVQLFREFPEVLAKYREQFQYVLVDEYQDTNRAQYELLRVITQEHRNLAVVGDDDQSIYGFRGADTRNIGDFQSDYPEARIVRLEQNYRCTDRILEVANAVIAHNDNRIEKQLWTASKTGGALVRMVSHEDPNTEAAWVATACAQLHGQGVPWGDMAVIYRTNATSQPFEAAMRSAGVPHKLVGGRPFYARREVRDALCYLRLIVNPADDAAFLRIVNVPTRGIGAVTVTKVREAATERGEPLLKSARNLSSGEGRAATALAGFTSLIDRLAEIAPTASLPAFVQLVLEETGYAQALRDEDTREARQRLENLNALLADAAAYELPEEDDPYGPVFEGPTGEHLSAWLDRIALSGADEEIPDGGQVALLTVHSSKGLEYPVVFVVNMVDGQFPHSRSAEEPEGFQEERRLAYVAFTRAKDRLVLSRCRHKVTFDGRRGRRQREPVARSPFLDQVPLGACEGDLPGAEAVMPTEEPRRGRDVGDDERARLRALITAADPARQRAWRTRREARWDDDATPRSVEDLEVPEEAPETDLDLPDDEYRTRPITSPDDLGRGTRVIHEVHGVGEVVSLKLPTVRITFRHGMQMIRVDDSLLQILRS